MKKMMRMTAFMLGCLSCLCFAASAEEPASSLDAAFTAYEESFADERFALEIYVNTYTDYVKDMATGLSVDVEKEDLESDPEHLIYVRELKDADILQCYKDNGNFEACLSDDAHWRMLMRWQDEVVAEEKFQSDADKGFIVAAVAGSHGEKVRWDFLYNAENAKNQLLSEKPSLSDASVTSVELVSLGIAQTVAYYIQTDEGDYLMPYNEMEESFTGLRDGAVYTVEEAIAALTAKAEENARAYAEQKRDYPGEKIYGGPQFTSAAVPVPQLSRPVSLWWIISSAVALCVVAAAVIVVIVLRKRAKAKR